MQKINLSDSNSLAEMKSHLDRKELYSVLVPTTAGFQNHNPSDSHDAGMIAGQLREFVRNFPSPENGEKELRLQLAH